MILAQKSYYISDMKWGIGLSVKSCKIEKVSGHEHQPHGPIFYIAGGGRFYSKQQKLLSFFAKNLFLSHVYWLCADARLRQLHLTSLLSSRGN